MVGHAGEAPGTGQAGERSPCSAAEGLSTGSSWSPLPPSAARTARRPPLPRRLPPAAPSSHLRDTRQVIHKPSVAQALAPGSTGAQSWGACLTSPPSAGHPLPKPSRRARKAAQDRTGQETAVCLHSHSSWGSTGNSFGARAVTQTTGLKLFPGDSLIRVSKHRSSGFLVFYLHKSFHSYLLQSTFDLPFTVLLQKSLSQQL